MAKLKTVNFQERLSYIHKTTGYSLDTIKKVLQASYLLDMNSIAEGKRVLESTYYTLYPEYRKERKVYNPVYDKEIEIKGHCVLKVKPHKKMQEALKIANKNIKDK